MVKTTDSPIITNGATSQLERRLQALSGNYVRPDERTLADLLDFAPAFGRLINFYSLRNQIDGDWYEFFANDPTIALASLAQIDLAKSEAEFTRLEGLTRSTPGFDAKFELLKQVFEVIYGLARLVNSSLRSLMGQRDDVSARLAEQAILSVLEAELAEPLQTLMGYDEGAGPTSALGRRIRLNYDMFLSAWGLKGGCPQCAIYSGKTPARKIDHALPYLDPILAAFVHGIAELQRSALANLAGSMESGEHSPNNALYIAFSQLFQYAQKTINTFTGRYSNFYYRDILREGFQAAVPDHLYLTFTLAASEQVVDATVSQGTAFFAGQDTDGTDIIYLADKSLTVTAAAIAQLRTLRTVEGPLLVAEPASRLQEFFVRSSAVLPTIVLRQIFSSEILLTQPGSENAAEPSTPAETAWATLGETHEGKSDVEITEPATLGFAVASIYLLLTGGQRQVSLAVEYSAAGLEALLAQIAQVTGLGQQEVLLQILAEAFKLYVSTAAGWLAIENYHVQALPGSSLADSGFILGFDLPPSAPPVVAYDPQNADGEDMDAGTSSAPVSADPSILVSPAPGLPTLKAYLTQTTICLNGPSGAACVYPLSLLTGMQIKSLQIHTTTSQLTGLQLENTEGPIDASAPFYIFGGLPVVGSYFLVRHQELFLKTLETLCMGVQWFNLPQNDDGFKGYYRDYVIGLDGKEDPNLFNNQSFHGGLDILNPGSWFLQSADLDCPKEPPPPVDVFLFRTNKDNNCSNPVPAEAGALCDHSEFSTTKVCLRPSGLPPYYDPSASAVRLALTLPKYAFGNDLFAQNVLNAVIEDLPSAETCQEKCDANCKFLADAAQWVAAALAACADTPEDQYAACIQPRLETCIAQLLLAFAECLVECLLRGLSGLDAKAVTDLQNAIQVAIQAQRQQRVNLLTDMVARWRGALSVGQGCDQCMPLLEAALCIAECEIGCSGDGKYKECMQKCLLGCQQSLEQAHAQCLQACMDDCMKVKTPLKYPSNPYVPQATNVSINYSAVCTIISSQAQQSDGMFFHLLPFNGYHEVVLPQQQAPELQASLLPQFASQGNLYIGFSEFAMAQKLSLLFQMSAAESLSIDPPTVDWAFLTSNRWTPLRPSQLVSDSTNGLQTSGITILDLPAPAAPGTIFPEPYQWLQASVGRDAGAFPGTVAIVPHVLTATWQDNGSAYEHLRKPLPAHTVSSSVEDLPDIQTIYQPIESFGGRPPETGETFDVRLSERLRHKDRAILGWDYERLVLQRFPTIWKVQALPARDLRQGEVPGSVLIVVVAGPDGSQVQDPTQPVASSALLSEIENYLHSLASPFIQIQVVNPIYVRIKVAATVLFKDQSDAGAGVLRLNNALVEYLSPWYYDPARGADGGEYVSEDSISEFIQTQPYVMALDSIQFFYEPHPETLAWCFMTSALQHEIHSADSAPAHEGRQFRKER